MKTQDAGSNWILQNTVTNQWLSAISFVDTTHGWLVSLDGGIWKSADGGDSWIAQKSITTKSLNSVFFVDPEIGWAVGDGGTIIHRIMDATSDITNTDTSIPEHNFLHQNYPNPFNPTTNIRYDLPNSAQVNLAIYTLLGEKVRTLVAGQQPAGAHTVQWDGRDEAGAQVASGVYFYQISAQDASGSQQLNQSRKLLLLR